MHNSCGRLNVRLLNKAPWHFLILDPIGPIIR